MRGTHRFTGSLALASLMASWVSAAGVSAASISAASISAAGIEVGGIVMSGIVVGCGQAPPPPTAIQSVGAGSKGQTDSDVLTVRPSPDAVMQTPPPTKADEESAEVPVEVDGSAEAPPDEPDADPPPAAAQTGQVFSACHETRVVGCDAVYVRMVKSAPDVCVQLVLDNCSENGRTGLPVVVPISWRLASGSASTNRGCDVREYDPKSQPVLSASGKVTFAQQGRQVSALAIDVQLSLDPDASESKLPAQIAVATPSPIGGIADCVD